MDKKAEFGFVWIFAIFAGTAILLLMIYGATKAVDTTRVVGSTKIAAEISSKLDTLEAGSAGDIKGKISISVPVKLDIFCNDFNYGENSIQVSTKSNIGSKEWTIGKEIDIPDKYIFADKEESSKKIEVYSIPFNYPYKISDLIFLSSDKYCFENAPNEIKTKYASMSEIIFDNCTSEYTSVCFDAYGCDITVGGLCSSAICETEYDYGLVKKGTDYLYYADSLLLAAIMSDAEPYECNVKRLMFRAGKIAAILEEKAGLTSARGCNTNIDSYLSSLKNSFPTYTHNDFTSISESIIELDKLNDQEICGLW